ncbi:MAG: tetratricopeptide repeat protein [Balneola sp.]|nr:tetratricopeptide repeat protein [Balneola sp.]MBO6649582.1 tetratricopeptide repeat protein [Balneola sp.]MBO6711399.1 tetratricopeptide repeat protein [Balneola sp.]MBO6801247.1 tetratricopeptide repeat protein [Balneola sp.]MBO6869335.1 tetratricopeptide repeat protein [Balneola sp.]
MKKNFYKLLSFAVLATIVISCGGETNPLIKEAKDGIKAKNYDAALSSLDQAIVQDSANADAYYYKGKVYSEIALNNSIIADRKDSYSKMRENLVMANELYTSQGAKSLESVESQLLIDQIWGQEHNLGVKYATGDSTTSATGNPYDVAEDHLENAIIINPDSLLSYEVLAEVYRLNSNLDAATDIYEQVIEKKVKADAYDYDRLGGLYLQVEEYEAANTILKKGIEFYPDSVFLTQKLADSYMNLGENEESIKVIESLIAREPNNPQYHLVLGTQVYIMASEITDDISAKYDEIFNLEREQRNLSGAAKTANEEKLASLRNSIEEQSSRSEKLIDRAVEELLKVVEIDPNDANAYNTLGIIYQNKAAALFDKRNATADNDEAAKIDTQAKDNLREAMKYYEKATELRPNNQDYWRSLFQVYTSLGMNEKAEAAMEKAGM